MAGTFNIGGSNADVFASMSDDDDDDIGFNLDGSAAGGDDEPAPVSKSRHAASVSSGGDMFDDDLPSDSEDSDPYVDPNDFLNEANEEEPAPAPVKKPARRGRPPKAKKKAETQPQPAQQPAGNDGMNTYTDYNQQYPQPDYAQQPTDEFNQQYATQPTQSDYSQQYPQYADPNAGNDGMNTFDYNQMYNQPQQGGYTDYSQQYPQQEANPFDDPNAGMSAWPQQDYNQQAQNPVPDYSQVSAVPDYGQSYQQPQQGGYQQQTPVSTPVNNAVNDSSVQQAPSSYQSASNWNAASMTIPQPEMIFRIIKVSDMIRDHLSGEEKNAVKLVLNMSTIKVDETSEMVYAVLNARKNLMTALDELLRARDMEASSRAFYLIRLDDSDLNTIADLGSRFGSNVTIDKTKKDHYSIAELAEHAVSTMPDSSVNLLQAVSSVYAASKDIMNNG